MTIASMELKTVITFAITLAGFIMGIIWKIVDISVKMGKMWQRIEQNEERDKEERAYAKIKFNELYNRTTNHEALISGLANNVTNLASTCSRIESKLDRLIEKQ